MSKQTLEGYPHLEFKRCWQLTLRSAMNLGRCSAYIEALGALPIPPTAQRELRLVSFRRGAQATTAIEGNTLTDEEIKKALNDQELPKSREYQAQEVKNALESMNMIWTEVVQEDVRDLITAGMLCRWNKLIGKELGPLYDGAPGRFRRDRRHVGTYLAPPPEHAKELVTGLCNWLRNEFNFARKAQTVEDAIQQAIAAHVYFEWIHPFADGNGRTGRLLEFYILLRAGFPDITVHILANHYNQTRTEYAAHFDRARKSRDLTQFLEYAVQGLTDGLKDTLAAVQHESCKTAWESHVYRVFDSYTNYNKKSVFKRRRALALAMPIDEAFSPITLVRGSDHLATAYMGRDRRMLKNDASVLVDLELMVPTGEDDQTYRANIQPMLAKHLSSRAQCVSEPSSSPLARESD